MNDWQCPGNCYVALEADKDTILKAMPASRITLREQEGVENGFSQGKED